MKKLFSILITVALLLTFAVFALGSGDSEKTSVEKNSEKTEQSSTEKRTEINVGETLNANNFNITYDSVEKWVSSNQFIQPGEGKQFVRLHLTISNDSGADRIVSSSDFECYADGIKCDANYLGDDALALDNISSGRKVSGYIYFEVPTAATEIEVEYETSFWTDKKAYFIVKL